MIARILAWLRRRPPAATARDLERDLGPYRTAPAPLPAPPSHRDRADEERVVRAIIGDGALRRDVQDVLDALQAEREDLRRERERS